MCLCLRLRSPAPRTSRQEQAVHRVYVVDTTGAPLSCVHMNDLMSVLTCPPSSMPSIAGTADKKAYPSHLDPALATHPQHVTNSLPRTGLPPVVLSPNNKPVL